jgi:putative nucleotidyltransferase with HDIG domain
MAINDLAGALTTSYEELSMLHNLLSDIAVRTDATEIGELLVDETTRTLNCRRVSLLVMDERGKYLRVLAARGVPEEARAILIPTDYSVAGHVLSEDGLLMVDDIAEYPELVGLSRGNYETGSFAIVRVPLSARGEAVGVLTATERNGAPEFTARDRKLFEGLSSIGASALLSCRLHATVNEQMMSTIQALATAVDAKDHYTHDHSGRVARLCVATVRHMGIIDPTTCREVELAGLLHDIGKIGIPDSILSKTEGLTAQEYATVKSHAHIGARIVEQVKGLERVAKAIRHHHERHDGLGYPLGLSGATIPLASKLISAADVFDTLTSDRPYRKRVSSEEAVRELRQSAGTQQDPSVVEALIAVVRQEMKLSKRAKQQHVVACEPT